jgi:hypothetical protein
VLRLNRSLPGGLSLVVDTVEEWGGVAVFTYSDGESWGGSSIANMDDTVDCSDVECVVEAALDAIQDDVAEASRGIAWPTDPTSEGPLPRALGEGGSRRSFFRLRLPHPGPGHPPGSDRRVAAVGGI